MSELGLNGERLREAIDAFVELVEKALLSGRNGSLSLEIHHADAVIRKADIGGIKRLTF